jgi:ATP-dependent Clp protease ATP-binding subunit ClpC
MTTSEADAFFVEKEPMVRQLSGPPDDDISLANHHDTQRLLRMEESLSRRVLGQEDAIAAVAQTIRRRWALFHGANRPLAAFFFAGPDGVGKTTLARALAAFLYGDEKALVQIEMSDFMERHNVPLFTGIQGGVMVGDEEGRLTGPVRQQPCSVVMLREIEKAHPEIWDIIIQIMDEGSVTDGAGRLIDFRNTALVMSTTIGADTISGLRRLGEWFPERDPPRTYEYHRHQVEEELRNCFLPAFLERLDEVIIFQSLSRLSVTQIVEFELLALADRVATRGLRLKWTEDVRDVLINEGYSSEHGVRLLRRTVERLLMNPLADELLRGTFEGRSAITVRVQQLESECRLAFEAE